jgi:cell wall-associated NlpC family hydrolase
MGTSRCLPPSPTVERALVLVVSIMSIAACTPFQRGMPGDASGNTAGAGPDTSAPTGTGVAVLRVAESMIGAPYRYGGAGPDAFDCSGLVSYSFRQIGVAVPRTAAEQFAAATPVKRRELQAGDLVFFRLDGRDVSHVGIYAGDDRFVHAPQRGGNVRVARLDDEVFRRGWAGAGRFRPAD